MRVRLPIEAFIPDEEIKKIKELGTYHSKKRGKIIVLDSKRGTNGLELPKEGGILTYYLGVKYPIKGFLETEYLYSVGLIKGMIRGGLNFLTSKPVRYFTPLLIFLPRRIYFAALKEMAKTFKKQTRMCDILPIRLCKSGRAIYRVGNRLIHNNQEVWERLLKTLCLIWEYDDAYRHIGQDIIGEIDLEAFRENPQKEVMRLFDLMVSRQVGEERKQGWNKIRPVISILLKVFNKRLKKLSKHTIQNDINDIKLDKGDIYHCLVKNYYNFQGRSFKDRYSERQMIDRQYWNTINFK